MFTYVSTDIREADQANRQTNRSAVRKAFSFAWYSAKASFWVPTLHPKASVRSNLRQTQLRQGHIFLRDLIHPWFLV